MTEEVDRERKKLLKAAARAERALLASEESEEQLYAKALSRLEGAERTLATASDRVLARKREVTRAANRLEQAQAARAAGPAAMLVNGGKPGSGAPVVTNKDNAQGP